MRLLLVPIISISNLVGDSDWHSYKELMLRFTELHPVFFYVLLPKKHIEAAEKDYPNDNALFLESPHDITDYHRDSLFLDMAQWRKMFSAKAGRYMVDAVIASRVPMHVPMALAINDMRRRGSIPVFCHDPYPRRIEPNIPFAERMARAMSYVYSYTWCLNSYEDKLITRFLQKHVSPAMVKEYKSKRRVSGRGLDFERLAPLLRMKKFKKFSILFGARINTDKNAGEAFEFLEKMSAFGRDLDVYITQPKSGVNDSVIGDFRKRASFLKFYMPQCNKDQYLAIMPHCHASVCTSRLEGEPKGFLEQLYVLRGLTIFPDKPWARAVLPKNFPWFYKNKTEGHALLRYFYTHRQAAIKKISWLREWLEENKNQLGIIDEEWSRIYGAVDTYWATAIPNPGKGVTKSDQGSFREQIAELANKYKKEGILDFSVFRNQLSRMSISIKFGKEGALRAPAVYAVYVDLIKAGWRDTYEKSYPILYWPEKQDRDKMDKEGRAR
ncbi:MAG TPA: hypothetical protein VMW91_08290 [Desulfosporosinus sp.]|nr:hypothetical protein [Desulfosporosinus sp.]